ncbi:MAG: hypothetical protein KDD02_11460 [Phaeodactylibacter sp.]|nr:hypothetical protein [Phaeodactylibacter sp.]MCB9302158.1 hypothetical protein [Lewinellaceae bacterium]HQU58857.1 hypothetical protein [Saprospiraceae bacterium]
MKKNILLLPLLLFFAQPLLAGGGWPQPKGRGYFKLSQWWVVSDQHFTDVGKIDPNVTNGIFNTSLYAEYGFTDRLTGVLYFPFFSRAYFNNTVSGATGEVITPGEAINSLGDTDVGIKFGLTQNHPLAISATLTFGLPLGNDSGGSAGNLQTGDGEFNQMIQLDAGRGFRIGKHNAYANAYLGFNNRTNDFSDELRFGVEGGITVLQERLTLIARLYGVKSMYNGKLPSEMITSTSIFANNTEYLSFSPEIAYNITDKWGVAASAGGAFYGRLIAARPSYSVGVYFRL